MDVRVLGPIRVIGPAGDAVLGAKERTVLALLATRVGQVVGYEELIDSLWPDDPPRTARRTLQAYVARLRGSLEAITSGAPAVGSEDHGYRLALSPDQIDAHRFAQMAALGRRALDEGRPASAEATLGEALALWHGPPFSGVDAPFAIAEQRRLEEIRSSAHEDLLAARIALGRDLAATAAELEAGVSRDPLREHAWALLARAYAALGDQARALGAVERARTALAEELGVDPGPELQSLHARVLAQDPTLLAGPVGTGLPAGLTLGTAGLIGRHRELETLQDLWRRARDGAGVRVLLTGPPGVGRWRLACALAGWVHDSGGRVVLDAEPAPAPALRVADIRTGTVVLPEPRAGELQLVVTDGPVRTGLPDSPLTIEVHPLTVTEVRELLAGYTPADVHPDVLDDAALQVLSTAGSSIDRVHEESLQWARDLLSGRVARAAGRSAAAGEHLDSERAALARDVLLLQQLQVQNLAEPGECPWPGLANYTARDAARFAGRDRLTAQLLSRLSSGRTLLLVGPSGSGKTSLLHAGLLASLAAGALPGSEAWRQIVMRPGARPMERLLAALVDQDGGSGTDPAEAHGGSRTAASGRTLLVVDQLEECWTTCTDTQERDAFLRAISELARRAHAPVTLVAAVRADHAGSIAGHADLAEELAGRVVFIGPMSEPDLRRAIEIPAARAGLALDDGLADALVEETLRQPGGLPLLSAALSDLWAHRAGQRLLLAQYLASGGVGAAIARMAEQALGSLDDQHQHAARTLFGRLAGPGEGEHVTRRRMPLSELEALSDHRVRECVEPLARARLLTVSDGEVEVAHEALFRSWPRLRDWLAEDAAARDLLRRIGHAAAEWDAEGREPAGLWAGARLGTAADLLAARPEDFTSLEREFVAESVAAVDAHTEEALAQARVARRRNRRLRGLLGAMAATLVVALVAGSVAAGASREARARSVTATAQRLAATALTEPNLALRMLTAVESVRTEESPQTRGALLSVLEGSSAALGRLGASSGVVDVDVAPGGTTGFVATAFEEVLAVDLASGGSRLLWRKPNAEFSAIRVSPDERHVALTALVDGALRTLVIDTGTGKQVWEVPFMAAHEAGFAFTAPDELALAGRTALVLFRIGQAQPLARIPWPDMAALQKARMLRVDDHRVLLLRGSAGAPARLVDVRTGVVTLLRRVWSAAAVSPDGRLLVTQRSFPGDIEVLDLDEPGTPTRETIPYRDLLTSAVFLPGADGGIALGGAQGGVVVVRTGGAVRQQPLGEHSGPVTGLAVTPDGFTLWSTGADGDLLAWDLSNSRGLRRIRGNGAPGLRGTPSADGGLAAVWAPQANGATRSAEASGSVFAMDLGRGSLLTGPLPAEQASACDAGLSPDGRTLLALTMESPARDAYTRATEASTLEIYDLPSGRPRTAVPLPHAACAVTVTPDSTTALVNGVGGVTAVDLATGSAVRTVDLPSMYLRHAPISVSPDGRWVAVARSDRVVVLSLADLADVASWAVGRTDSVADFAWVQDAATLVQAGAAGQLSFRSIPGGQQLPGAEVASSVAVVDLAASADGHQLASLAASGDLTLWDPTQRRVVGTPLAAPADIGSVLYTPELRDGGFSALADEGRLGWVRFGSDASGGFVEVFYAAGARAVRYPLDTDDLITRACALAGREPTAQEWLAMHPGNPQRPTCGSTSPRLLMEPALG